MTDSKTDVQTHTPYVYPSFSVPESEDNIEEEPSGEKAIDVIDTNDQENELPLREGRDTDDQKEKEKPLLEEETVKIDIDKDGDTPTLPLPNKEKGIKDQKETLPKYLFPCTRIRDAWRESSNMLQFLGKTTCIIFQTVGWFTCVGGVPFVSVVMIIIGSLYVDDCKIESNIPVYLIVSGITGTIQHVLAIWTKYVTKDKAKGKLKVYRSYCRVFEGFLHLFSMIWFICGCVWVYGAKSDVIYDDPERNEYCHKTLYCFSFWILNLSFMLFGLLLFLTICFLLCYVAADDKK